ncbi:MAG: hypothetical protein HYY61_07230, partial [Deltaproteobacteria bacterium]|nr:hypothetical protein [Deltaproteobacteria bacterium]
MKKIILLILTIFLLTPLSFGKSSPTQENLKEEKIKIEIEKVVSKKIPVHPPATYPSSRINRPLTLPQELINGEVQVNYHYFSSSHVGANMRLKGQYGWREHWELNAETSLFPQTQKGIEFGGLRGGFLYRFRVEDEENPEIALGAKIGFLGTGSHSLTQGNTISFYPQGLVKKVIGDRAFSIQGELLAGIGDKDSGIHSLNALATLKTADSFDLGLKGDLQNLGYSSKEIFSLTPSLEYHLYPNWDISGGVQIGLLGA